MKIGRIDWRAAAIVSAFVLQVFFFAPLQVFLNNILEFSVSFSRLFVVLLLVSTALVAVLYVAGKVWPRVVLPAVTFLSVVAFLEAKVFLGLAQHRPFDGQLIDWSQFGALSAAELATAAMVGVLVVVFRRRGEIWYSVSLFILLFCGLGSAYSVVSADRTPVRPVSQAKSNASYRDEFSKISRTRNVVHIVTDGTTGSLVYEILNSDRGPYSDIFDGFTLYRRAAGRYLGTYPSVPFYMTGRAPEPADDVVSSLPFTHDYIKKVLTEHSIVNALASKGFTTHGFQIAAIYCAGEFDSCTAENIFAGKRNLSGGVAGTVASYVTLLDIALFQNTPIVIRRLIFNDQRWLLTRFVTSDDLPGVLNAFTENLETTDTSGSYTYIHHMGGHPPIEYDADCNYVGPQRWEYNSTRAQLTCVLAQIKRLVEKLKALQIYDQTMILVHGDHGGPHVPPLITSRTGTVVDAYVIAAANPLILIKPPGAHGPLRFSDAPASIGDIPATINAAFDLGYDFPGLPLDRVEQVANREREFLVYKLGPEVFTGQALPLVRRFRIRGDVLNQYDWIPPHWENLEEAPSALFVNHERFSELARGFSRLSEGHGGRSVRWIEGQLARVYLSFPSGDMARLVLDSYVPPSIRGQSVEISINERIIATLDDTKLAAGTRHAIPVPDDVPRRKINTVELKMGKAVQLDGDRRNLSMVVAYVGLEPVE